jgi:hypothetical protein
MRGSKTCCECEEEQDVRKLKTECDGAETRSSDGAQVTATQIRTKHDDTNQTLRRNAHLGRPSDQSIITSQTAAYTLLTNAATTQAIWNPPVCVQGEFRRHVFDKGQQNTRQVRVQNKPTPSGDITIQRVKQRGQDQHHKRGEVLCTKRAVNDVVAQKHIEQTLAALARWAF